MEVARNRQNQNRNQSRNRRTQTLTLSFLIERAPKRAKTRLFNNLLFCVNYVFIIFLNKLESNLKSQRFPYFIFSLKKMCQLLGIKS